MNTVDIYCYCRDSSYYSGWSAPIAQPLLVHKLGAGTRFAITLPTGGAVIHNAKNSSGLKEERVKLGIQGLMDMVNMFGPWAHNVHLGLENKYPDRGNSPQHLLSLYTINIVIYIILTSLVL